MRQMFFAILAGTVVAAMAPSPAAAWIHQQGDEQRLRDLERRLRERDQELRELRRRLEESGDPRMRIGDAPRVRVGPYGGVGIFPDRPKFGFMFHDTVDTDRKPVARVMSVAPGSPAERAGLKAGDVITMFNGVRLQDRESPAQELRRQAQDLQVGDTIQVEYRRGGDRQTVTMVAEDLDPGAFAWTFLGDSAFSVHIPRPRVGGDADVIELMRFGARWLDMELVALEKDLGEYFGVGEGVLVVRAPRDTALNLRSGDVILAIEGRKAMNPAQVMRVLRSYEPGETFEMQVMRQKKKVTVTARIPVRDRGFFYQSEY